MKKKLNVLATDTGSYNQLVPPTDRTNISGENTLGLGIRFE